MELTRNHLYKGDLCHVQYTTKSFQWERLKWLCSEIFSKYHVGKLLAKCNGMKEKGVSPVSLLRYKLSNIFVGRNMYMQQQTGSFKEAFSKNTFYVSLILQKQTGFVLLLFLQPTSSTMTFLIWQIRKEKKSSSLMTVFSTAPAVRKQNWAQEFLTIQICISKRGFGCLL